MHFEFLEQGLAVTKTKKVFDCGRNFKLDQS